MAAVAVLKIVLMMALIAGLDVGLFAVRILFGRHGVRRMAHGAFPNLIHAAFFRVRNEFVGIDGSGICLDRDPFGNECFKRTVTGQALLFGHFGCMSRAKAKTQECNADQRFHGGVSVGA